MDTFEPDDRPESTQRIALFFALKPDRPTATKIRDFAFRQSLDRGMVGRPLAANRLHITLMSVWQGVGPAPASVMSVARSIGDAIKRAPFRVSFDRAGSFSGADGNRPYVLLGEDGVIDAAMLHRDLAGASLKFSHGERALPRITLHTTILYDALQLPIKPIAPISWFAREFVLIESWRGRTRHIERGRWPLAGRTLGAATTSI